jgi:natural product biosynthesis luciferase-like monooxygenase protein
MIAQPETLIDLLKAAAQRHGDRTLYRFLTTGEATGPQETLTATGLLADISRLAGGLRSSLPELEHGPQTIVIACWSPLDFARGFFGCLAAGATPVPAYPPPLRATATALDPLKSIIVDCKASALIGEERSAGAILRVEPEFEKTNACRLFRVDELMVHDEAPAFARSSANDPAFLQYTSGSTTEPRGVIITNENILSNLKSIVAALDPPQDGIGVSWLPWSHDLGLIGNFLMRLYADINEMVVMTPLAFIEKPARWLQAISHFRAWGTSAPNFAFALCNKMIRKGQVEGLDLSCLQSVLCGAEPIDAATLDRFSHRFAPQGFRRDSLRPCYGLAEATLFVSLAERRKFSVKAFEPDQLSRGVLIEADQNAHSRNIVSCGIIQPALEVAIVDPETNTRLAGGQIGEVWISGPAVAKGYFGWTEEQNAEVFRVPLGNQRFLRTGDLGALHGSEVFITGRCKDLIIVHGKNYDAHDLERVALAAHPDLRSGHVVVFSDLEEGERVVVLAETPADRDESDYAKIARQIRAKLGERLGLRPDVVELVPLKTVALTSSGKLRREKVRRRWRQGQIEILFSSPLSSEVESDSAGDFERPLELDDFRPDVIEKALLREVKIAARLGEQERLPGDARLSELGVDSLGLVQIATSMGEFLNREIPLSLVDDDPTLDEVLARFHDAGTWDQETAPSPAIPATTSTHVHLEAVSSNGSGNGNGASAPVAQLAHGNGSGSAPEPAEIDTLPELSVLFFASADRVDESNRYRFVRDAALLADRKGFAAVWVPERHFHPFGGLFPSPSVLGAALSSHTSRIRLRAGSVVLPLNDPVRVAEEWAMVDNLSQGRVDLALATGWDADSFILAPENYEHRQDVLFESAHELMRLWKGETLTRTNGVGVKTEIRTYPRPVQPNLNVWITATHRPDLFERAGRKGLNVLTALLIQDLNTLDANIQRYRNARKEAGFDTPGRVSVMLHTYVGSSNDEARDIVRGPLAEYLKSAIDLWKRESEELRRLPADKVAEVALKRYINRSSLIGDGETAVAMLQRLRAMSVDEVACLIDFGVAHDLALESLQRLDEAVTNARLRNIIGNQTSTTSNQTVPDLPPDLDPDIRHTLKESAFDDVFEAAHRFQLTNILKQSDMLPFYQPFTKWEGTHGMLGDRRVLILSALDYLGLATNERVKEAAARAAQMEGTGRSGSRVHSGTTPEILAMEEKLAAFLDREDAVICTTGYQAMAGVVTTFMNSRTTLVIDEAVHASIVDGSAIARCRLLRFRHNDYKELDSILSQTKSVMVMVEGLYSNDGDISPLPDIRDVCARHGVRLALDDAHGLGVLGATGRGTEEHHSCIGAADIIAGTFSKSLASIGGWIAGDHEIIEYVRYHGRTVLFTAALSPPMLAAASMALDVLIERPELVHTVGRNADQVRYDLRRLGVTVTGQHGPVIRIPIGSDRQCVRLSSELLHRGIFVHTVLYPSVPKDEAMIRLCISAEHDPADLRWAVSEFADIYHALDLGRVSDPEYVAAASD